MAPNIDIKHLLSSDVVPDVSEAASVNLQLDALAGEIAHLKLRLADLEDQHWIRRAILSPVRRIPPETLGDIFVLAMPSSLILDRPARGDLLRLCLVCRSWRQAALLTKSLWGGVEFLPEDTYAYNRTVCWLARAGGTHKTVALGPSYNRERCQCPEVPCPLMNPLLSRLFIEGPVIDQLNILCTNAKCFRYWVASLKRVNSGPLPWDALQALRIELLVGQTWEDFEWTEIKHSAFWDLPIVSKLALVLPDYRMIPANIRGSQALLIPGRVLEQLTSLELHCNWAGSQIYQVLSQCVNLDVLLLVCRFQESERVLFPSPLRLPKLRTLRIEQVTSRISILNHFITPALIRLDLGDFSNMLKDGGESFCTTLAQFLNNSNVGQQLQELTVDDAGLEDRFLMSLLVSLPGLKHLALRHSESRGSRGGVWAMLREAATMGDRRSYLPTISTIELLGIQSDYNLQNLLDWIGARPSGMALCYVVASYNVSAEWLVGETEQMKSRNRFDVVHDWHGGLTQT